MSTSALAIYRAVMNGDEEEAEKALRRIGQIVWDRYSLEINPSIKKNIRKLFILKINEN